MCIALLVLFVDRVAVAQIRSGPSSTHGDPATDAFRAGSEAYQRGDLRTAHMQFARVVRLAPKVAAGHSAFGTVLLAENNPKAAMAELEQAHRLDPGDNGTTLNLAFAHVQLNDRAAAIPLFRAADEAHEPFTPEQVIAYANALEANSRLDLAKDRIERALIESPGSAVLHDALGTVLVQSEQYGEAEMHFRHAIELDPALSSAFYHLGSLYLLEGNPSDALAPLTQAHHLVDNNPAYAVQIGRALRAVSQDEESIRILRQAVQLAPTSIDASYELALSLQASGNPRDAIPLFQRTVKARPDDCSVLTNYALALVQVGDAKTAIPLFQQALGLTPGSPTLREDLGVAYLQQADLDHAIEQFLAGLAIAPSNSQLHYDLGLAYKLKDNVAAAIPEFEKAAILDPSLPDPPYTLGILYMQLARFPDAQTQLERATTLRPDHGDAWAMLGNVYKQNDQPQKAIAALRHAIQLMPAQPSPHITLASVLVQLGDTTDAVSERRIAADLSRAAVGRQRAQFALDSGRALLKQGNVKQAVEQLEAAVTADPNYSEAHVALAQALTRQGRIADAAVEREQGQRLAHTQGPSTESRR
jgi:tetratricopeptide (TPR) repeat protein